MNRIEFDKKREISEIIDDSYSFIKMNGRELFVLMLSSVAPFLFVMRIIQHKITPQMMEESSIIVALQLLMVFSAQALMHTVVYGYIFSKIEGTVFGRDELWLFVKNNFLIMLSAISSVFIVLVLGFFAMIVPGIYLIAPVSFVFIHRLRTGEPFFMSFGYLLQLVRWQWFRSMAVILISALTLSFFGLVLLIPHFFWGFDFKAPTSEGSIITAFSFTLFHLLTSLIAVPVTMLYFHLKKIKSC